MEMERAGRLPAEKKETRRIIKNKTSIKEEAEKQVGAHVSAPVRVTLPLLRRSCLPVCVLAGRIYHVRRHTHIHARGLTFLGPFKFHIKLETAPPHLHLETHLIHWWRPLSWWTLSSRRHMAQYFDSVLLLPLLAYQTCTLYAHTYILCESICLFFIYFELIFVLLRFAGKCRFYFFVAFTCNCCYIYYMYSIYINIKCINILHIDSSSRLTSVYFLIAFCALVRLRPTLAATTTTTSTLG